MHNWLLRIDYFDYGDNREPDAATIAALQELVASRAGTRVVSLVQQFRQTPQRIQAEQEEEEMMMMMTVTIITMDITMTTTFIHPIGPLR
jgi:hypothetical protein